MMDDQGNVYARDKEIDNVVEGQWTDCTPVSQARESARGSDSWELQLGRSFPAAIDLISPATCNEYNLPPNTHLQGQTK